MHLQATSAELDLPAESPVTAAILASPSPLPAVLAGTAPLMLLAACEGATGTVAAPAPAQVPAPVAIVLPSSQQGARFLSQAAMGSNKADIARVAAVGFDAWITEQFSIARETKHWDWLVAGNYNVATNINSEAGFNAIMWRQLITGADQLRQRVGMALLDILVVGITGLPGQWRAFNMAPYVDILMDNAFGNYRDLLQGISLNSAMGSFLTFLGNRKASTTTGSVPDENYARELMQLFTLGLYKLNADGSQQLVGGQPVESYTTADVIGLARVFTGFTLDSTDGTTPDRYRRPMVQTAANHELGTKVFLGVTIPANTDGIASLKIALDTLFAHPNLPPFISQQLIQRLVTSNPSPAYVARISAVFENNGAGVRGDMKAIVRAILMDAEARTDANVTVASFGKLREPMMRLTNWARAFGATSPSDAWAIGDTSSTANRLGQSPGRAPSVFNFFRPGYTPPNSPIATQNLVAPELQITNEPSVVAYVNYMQTLIGAGTGDVRGNYTDILTKAADTNALVDEVNLLLGGQLTSATIATIRTAVDTISVTATNGSINRVYTAILLAMASPDYIVQR